MLREGCEGGMDLWGLPVFGVGKIQPGAADPVGFHGVSAIMQAKLQFLAMGRPNIALQITSRNRGWGEVVKSGLPLPHIKAVKHI